MKVSMKAAAKTDVGLARTNNEDNCGYDIRGVTFAVCDGMGGRPTVHLPVRHGYSGFSVLPYGGDPQMIRMQLPQRFKLASDRNLVLGFSRLLARGRTSTRYSRAVSRTR